MKKLYIDKGQLIGHLIAILAGFIFLLSDFIYFRDTPFFTPLLLIAAGIASSKFWIDFFISIQRQREIEKKFPEFVRNLVGAVKSGMPLTQSWRKMFLQRQS